MFVFFIFSSDGRSWAASRASVGGPGPLSVPLWVAPSRSQGLCGRCWPVLKLLWPVLGSLRSALRCYVGGLGPLLDSLLAVLGDSWSLHWRSWAALGTYVGGLGASCGLSGRSWAEVVGLGRGSGPKSGPNPSQKAVQGRGWKIHVFGPGPSCPFFSIDI